MKTKIRNKGTLPLALLAALLLALLAAVSVQAGGWAVISVGPPPEAIQPNQPFEVDFAVLQHGETPMVDLNPAPTVTFRAADSKPLVFEAYELDEPGRYRAEVSLPGAGSWDWSVQAFTMVQRMPALQVDPVPGVAPAAGSANLLAQPAALAAVVLLAGAVLLLGGALYLFRKTARRLAPLLLALSLLLAAGALLTGGRALAGEPAPQADAPVGVSLVEQGNATFTRRGCVTCHTHTGVEVPAAHAIDWGPDLSSYQASPEYLRQWLADPQAVRPTAAMPDLGLQAGEIEALIAFLNQDQTRESTQ